MQEREALLARIRLVNEESFDPIALDLFRYQASRNMVYQQWLTDLHIHPTDVKTVHDIPFLPIQAFKNHKVLCENVAVEKIFQSSGTTGQTPSQHFMSDLELYHYATKINFENYFGNLKDKIWLALLPSYLGRGDASLVDMVQYFMEVSDFTEDCGFFLESKGNLRNKIEELGRQEKEVFLIGVTFALLDWLKDGVYRLPSNVKVIETGGMKGRGEELTRSQLHQLLSHGFAIDHIYSEYGMTELSSQAYYLEDHRFHPGPGMKIFIRSMTDPLTYVETGQQGLINVVDLFNIDSCAFIATEDIGKVHADGSFDVLGRSDNSEIRGCNLMVQQE